MLYRIYEWKSIDEVGVVGSYEWVKIYQGTNKRLAEEIFNDKAINELGQTADLRVTKVVGGCEEIVRISKAYRFLD